MLAVSIVKCPTGQRFKSVKPPTHQLLFKIFQASSCDVNILLNTTKIYSVLESCCTEVCSFQDNYSLQKALRCSNKTVKIGAMTVNELHMLNVQIKQLVLISLVMLTSVFKLECNTNQANLVSGQIPQCTKQTSQQMPQVRPGGRWAVLESDRNKLMYTDVY